MPFWVPVTEGRAPWVPLNRTSSPQPPHLLPQRMGVDTGNPEGGITEGHASHEGLPPTTQEPLPIACDEIGQDQCLCPSFYSRNTGFSINECSRVLPACSKGKGSSGHRQNERGPLGRRAWLVGTGLVKLACSPLPTLLAFWAPRWLLSEPKPLSFLPWGQVAGGGVPVGVGPRTNADCPRGHACLLRGTHTNSRPPETANHGVTFEFGRCSAKDQHELAPNCQCP